MESSRLPSFLTSPELQVCRSAGGTTSDRFTLRIKGRRLASLRPATFPAPNSRPAPDRHAAAGSGAVCIEGKGGALIGATADILVFEEIDRVFPFVALDFQPLRSGPRARVHR